MVLTWGEFLDVADAKGKGKGIGNIKSKGKHNAEALDAWSKNAKGDHKGSASGPARSRGRGRGWEKGGG